MVTTHNTQQSSTTLEEIKALTKSIEALNKSRERADRQLDKTDKKIEKIAKLIGGLSNNVGMDTEEMFARYLSKRLELAGVKFYGLASRYKTKRNEYDIVMQNGSYAALIEVKYKAHPNDVDTLIKTQLPNFKKDMNIHDDKKVIVGLATPVVTSDVRERAEEFGVVLITQDGSNATVDNSPAFRVKMY